MGEEGREGEGGEEGERRGRKERRGGELRGRGSGEGGKSNTLCLSISQSKLHIQAAVHLTNSRDNMWQSRVEIKGYSIAYFNSMAAFEAPYR